MDVELRFEPGVVPCDTVLFEEMKPLGVGILGRPTERAAVRDLEQIAMHKERAAFGRGIGGKARGILDHGMTTKAALPVVASHSDKGADHVIWRGESLPGEAERILITVEELEIKLALKLHVP